LEQRRIPTTHRERRRRREAELAGDEGRGNWLTTKIHMAALLRALGARNRTEAAHIAGNNIIKTTGLADAEGRRTAMVA
jgi:hypothetical protein